MSTVRYQATGTGSGALTAVTPAWPAHETNDIGILLIETSNQAPPSTPTGWTIVSGSPQGFGTAAATGSSAVYAYWRRATSAAESAPSSGDSGDHQWGIIVTFRGAVVSGDPILTGSGGFTSASGSGGRNKDLPLVTASLQYSGSDILIVHSWERDSATAQWSGQGIKGSQAGQVMSIVTERSDAGTTQGNGGGFGIWTARASNSGSFGIFFATASLSTVGGWLNIAFRPQVGTTTRILQLIQEEDF